MLRKRWYREASESEVLLSDSLVFWDALFYHDNELDSQVERWMLGSLKVSSTVLGILLITFRLVIRICWKRATATLDYELDPLHPPSSVTPPPATPARTVTRAGHASSDQSSQIQM